MPAAAVRQETGLSGHDAARWASPVTRITGSAIATFTSKGYGIIPAVLDTRQLGAARAMVAPLLAAEPPEPNPLLEFRTGKPPCSGSQAHGSYALGR